MNPTKKLDSKNVLIAIRKIYFGYNIFYMEAYKSFALKGLK